MPPDPLRGLCSALALVACGAMTVEPRPARSPLERRIAERLATFKGVMGVAARNLGTGETVLLNSETRFPTASAIKTAVMVEVYHQWAEGRFRRDTRLALTEKAKVGGSGVLQHLGAGLELTVADLVTLMVTLSDNTATNLLIGLVGVAAVDRRLAGYGLEHTRLFRPTFRDGQADIAPELEREFGLGMTTPGELARLMELIAEGRVVSPAASEEMMGILERQEHRTMIPRLLPAEAGLRVGNKPGWDEEKAAGADGRRRQVRADAAIVRSSRGRYVIAICARQLEDTRWGPDNEAVTLGAAISRMVFDHFLPP